MRIDFPADSHIHQLRQLWKLAFQEEDAFVQLFFHTAYSPERCRCLLREDRVLAALYWFDTECGGQKLAYLYGVATHPAAQGQGLCRILMEDTRVLLKKMGYDGILLVPQKEELRTMYAHFGYQDATTVAEFFCTDDPYPQPIHAIDPEEYARLRRQYLPEDSVLQEGAGMALLAGYAKFYKGMDFVLAAAAEEESLLGIELLGNREVAPGILCALGYHQGTFRSPGGKKPFAMFLALKPGAIAPSYFGLAFD